MSYRIDLCAPAPFTATLCDADDAWGHLSRIEIFALGVSVLIDVPSGNSLDNYRDVVRKIIQAIPNPVVPP
jgi:hypothetical protein